MGERRAGNWLDTFMKWTLPRSEAQESLIHWSGLFCLASTLKRHVYIPDDLMGSYTIYPNLYTIFVGPPGAVRKSTSVGYAQRLLGKAEAANVASTAMSASQLIGALNATHDSSLSIISSEFASFVNVSNEIMYDALTDLYDNLPFFELGTRARGEERVEHPSINMIAATTPAWISNHMPHSAIGGGFSSRVIFNYQSTVRRRKLYHKMPNLPKEYFKDLEAKLLVDLRHIMKLEGEFRHDSQETMDYMEAWYQANANNPPPDERVRGYMERRHVHLHKLMMIYSVAENDDLLLTKRHFKLALKTLEDVESSMFKAFSQVGRNRHSADMEDILEYISSAGKTLHYKDIHGRFLHNLTKPELNDILDSLLILGEIKVEGKIKNLEGAKYSIKSSSS